MTRSFDELSSIDKFKSTYNGSFNYDDYFSAMDIPEEEKENVKAFALKLETVFLIIFALYAIGEKNNDEIFSVSYQMYLEETKDFLKFKQSSSYIEQHARKIILDTIETTNNNVSVEDIAKDDENNAESSNFYLSESRAKLIAANEASFGLNYSEYVKAVNSGKTKKTWVSEKDKHVRKTHQKVNGKTVEIFEPFEVGNSELMFPKDTSLGADVNETANCRCVVIYK